MSRLSTQVPKRGLAQARQSLQEGVRRETQALRLKADPSLRRTPGLREEEATEREILSASAQEQTALVGGEAAEEDPQVEVAVWTVPQGAQHQEQRDRSLE